MRSHDDTLVIGDVHGNGLRLERLLHQEGLLDHCFLCGGEGDVSDGQDEAEFCPQCKGSGLVRICHGHRVIQLGDLVDLMPMRTAVSADECTMTFASRWVDEFLWGNHEHPLRGGPAFSYYEKNVNILHQIKSLEAEGRYKLATHAHGFLITHAGLGDRIFQSVRTGSLKRRDPERLAAWLNRKDDENSTGQEKMSGYIGGWELRDAVGYDRGGWDEHGGIIWRDCREGLWDVPQIFGHTSHKHPLTIDHPSDMSDGDGSESYTSYCIDTSKHGSVSAIWLPSCRLVTFCDDLVTSTTED